VFTRCVFTISQILRTRFKIVTEKKKEKSNKNSVTKKQKYKWHYSYINLSFLFLYVHFKFGSKKFRDGKHKSNEHRNIFSKFFRHLEV
jgi:hypothetical protein